MAAWIRSFHRRIAGGGLGLLHETVRRFSPKPLASGLTIVLALASFWLLALAMKSLPLGTAYAIWTGIGAVGAFVVGIVFLGEAASLIRITAAVLIVAGLALMKIGSTTG